MSIAGGIRVVGIDGAPVALDAQRLDDLRSRLAGPLLLPGDADWDDAVLIWNADIARQPAIVVQPVSARDVAHAVAFARDERLLMSVKGGGHNIAGTAIADGGLTLDLSRMRNIEIDATARLAHVGGGCRLADVDAATQHHGLATPLGFISQVGVGGLTLGGGLGYLTRRFGWTVDNLERAQMVTADGQIRDVDGRQNADLLWAIRGGGGNFGVVTRFTLRLHRIGPTVVGGLIAWPFERADEILRAYRALTSQAPRELAVWLVLMHAPSAPFVPSTWAGRKVCAMAICYSGERATADRALTPIRALGEPVFDLVGPQPYAQVQSYLDDSEPKGNHYYWKTEFLGELDDELLSRARALYAACPSPGAQLGLLHLAGALNDRAADDGAVGNRGARYAIGANGMWEPGEPGADVGRAWVRSTWEQLRPFSTGGNYVNFQTADDDAARIAAAYGANLRRLREIKATHDPDNLFRMNRNITWTP
jgi:FAD/FMN-containing dehydrogenase